MDFLRIGRRLRRKMLIGFTGVILTLSAKPGYSKVSKDTANKFVQIIDVTENLLLKKDPSNADLEVFNNATIAYYKSLSEDILRSIKQNKYEDAQKEIELFSSSFKAINLEARKNFPQYEALREEILEEIKLLAGKITKDIIANLRNEKDSKAAQLEILFNKLVKITKELGGNKKFLAEFKLQIFEVKSGV
jgi:hypothetical protein